MLAMLSLPPSSHAMKMQTSKQRQSYARVSSSLNWLQWFVQTVEDSGLAGHIAEQFARRAIRVAHAICGHSLLAQYLPANLLQTTTTTTTTKTNSIRNEQQ